MWCGGEGWGVMGVDDSSCIHGIALMTRELGDKGSRHII